MIVFARRFLLPFSDYGGYFSINDRANAAMNEEQHSGLTKKSAPFGHIMQKRHDCVSSFVRSERWTSLRQNPQDPR